GVGERIAAVEGEAVAGGVGEVGPPGPPPAVAAGQRGAGPVGEHELDPFRAGGPHVGPHQCSRSATGKVRRSSVTGTAPLQGRAEKTSVQSPAGSTTWAPSAPPPPGRRT